MMTTMRIFRPLLTYVASTLFVTAFVPTLRSENGGEQAACGSDYRNLQERIYIDEVCVRPPAGSDWPVWVEIWNNSRETVDLRGYSLETLQTRIEPFGDGLRLAPDERCVVLAYSGETTSTNFESKLPARSKAVRCMNKTLFPSYFTMAEWRSKIRRFQKETSSRPMTDEELGRHVTGLFATTRYVNELAFRSPGGDLIGFLRWGAIYGKENERSAARQEAVSKGIFRDWDDVPRLLGYSSDCGCAVLQMLRHGTYLNVREAETRCTPGTPMPREPSVPKLNLPVACSVSGPSGSVVVKFSIEQQNAHPEFERVFGWMFPLPEIFYDRDMTRPVFANGERLDRDLNFGVTIHLRPADFFRLADRPLYCRLVKSHAAKPPVYSDLYEIRLFLGNGVDEEFLPLRNRCPKINYEEGEADLTDIEEYIARCNAAGVKYRLGSRLIYNIVNAGREVVLSFVFKKLLDDISPLAGLPIKKLDISDSRVSNLDALKGMSLSTLDLRNTPVKDIAALQGMPLETLNIAGTEVTDVSPLIECPLKRLTANPSKVRNLDVLTKDIETKQEEKGQDLVIEFLRAPGAKR